MAARSQQLRVVISGDASALKRTLASAQAQGSKFEKHMGGVTSRVGSAIRHLSVGAFAGAGFGLMSLVRAGAAYEKEMARVKAVTGATGTQFKGLGDLAKQLGKDTKFSAGEAAQAMYELGSAGFKANEMAAVLPGTLSLAAASSVDLKDAAEISSNALRGFSLAGSKSTHVADVLAQAVAASSVEMVDLQYTLKYIGPVAKLTGQSFETMIAATELMGNAGIKGEAAGTALRGAMVRLTKPTKQVEAGMAMLNLKLADFRGPKGLKPLPQLIALIETHMKGLTKAQQNTAIASIFGTYALSGMSAVINQGSKKLQELTRQNERADGAAKKMATTMNNTVAGAFENFTGSVETAGISIFEKFQVPLRKGLLGAAKLINDLTDKFGEIHTGHGKIKPLTIGVNGDPARKEAKSTLSTIGQMMKDGVESVDWGKVGKTISRGIANGIKLSGDFANAVEQGINQALSDVNGEAMLSGLVRVLGQAITAVFNPGWWKDHFSDILATVEIVIPLGKILKIPGAGFLFDHITKPLNSVFKKVGSWLLGKFKGIAGDGITGFLTGLEKFAPKTAHAILSVVTGTGKWLGGLPGKFKSTGSKAVDAITGAIGKGVGSIAEAVGKMIGAGLKKLGSLVPDFVKAGAKFAHELISGLVRGLTSLPKTLGGLVKKGLKAIGGAVGIGEGLGKAMGPVGGGKGSSALMGAQGALGPYAAIGARFGLHVSSGRAGREGKLTSSGNVSYHSTGEAIDEADGVRGPSAAKMRFFKYMRDRFGSRLAELIYTPGGAGIKDGRPYTYTGQVAADHFDHVHVALDTGKPGVGDGLGKGSIMNLWTRAGGSPGAANLAAAVAMAESGGKTNAVNRNTDGSIDRGLWQINSVHGALSTFSPFGNARAAVKISSKGTNWHPWVTYNTGAYRKFLDGSNGGASRDALDKRLQHNLDQLDTLRNSLAKVPADRHHVKQRKAIQAQIRALVSSNRTLRGDIRDAPTATDIKAQQEKAGSRIVNAVANPFFRGKGGINALNRFTAGRERVIGEKDTEFGQASRLFDQTDEDLGTAGGRAHRTSELKELAVLKKAQLARQQARLKALNAEIGKYTGLIKALKGKLKGKNRPKGATAARIHKRLIDYENRKIELLAEARALGSAMTDTKLDIGDLAKEAADVAATPDTVPEPGPTVTDQVSNLVDLINLREHAGVIDPATAQAQREAVISAGIQGKFGATTEREQLQLMGDLKDSQAAAVQAVEDNTSALRDLEKTVADNTAFARSVMAVENASLTTSIAGLISGEIAGKGIAGRALMPGTAGVRARY
jgi:TP901 family phage tail tape measure protein